MSNTQLEKLIDAVEKLVYLKSIEVNSNIEISPSLLLTLDQCIEQKKEISLYTEGYRIEGIPLEIKDRCFPYAMLVLRIDSTLSKFNSSSEKDGVLSSRVGFKYEENHLYIKNISSIDIQMSLAMEVTELYPSESKSKEPCKEV